MIKKYVLELSLDLDSVSEDADFSYENVAEIVYEILNLGQAGRSPVMHPDDKPTWGKAHWSLVAPYGPNDQYRLTPPSTDTYNAEHMPEHQLGM